MALILPILVFLAAPVHAAQINVSANAPDVLNGADGSCSLREAIQNINNGANTYNDCSKVMSSLAYGRLDRIILPAGTYTNSIANAAGHTENLNASGDLDIDKSVLISGAGAATTIINGNGTLLNDRVLDVRVAGITVRILNVTVQGGAITGTHRLGGGIASIGELTVENAVVTGNTAIGIGALGGGIYSTGILTVLNSTISSNNGSGGGGGIASEGTLMLTGSIVDANQSIGIDLDGIDASGGGIYSTNPSTINTSTISNNAALKYGGGIYSSANMTIDRSTISVNIGTHGAGVYQLGGVAMIANSTISSNLSRSSTGWGAGVFNRGTMEIVHSTITANSTPDLGAGLFTFYPTLSIKGSIVAGNDGEDCGGFSLYSYR